MLIAISIISIMVVIIVPTFIHQNEKIQLDTLSEELINTLQLVQTYAYTSQTEVIVSLNVESDTILTIGTQHPGISSNIKRTSVNEVPKFIDVETNIEVNKIIFQPNKSWELFFNNTSVTAPNFDISLKNQTKTKTIKFYPHSKSIHLLD